MIRFYEKYACPNRHFTYEERIDDILLREDIDYLGYVYYAIGHTGFTENNTKTIIHLIETKGDEYRTKFSVNAYIKIHGYNKIMLEYLYDLFIAGQLNTRQFWIDSLITHKMIKDEL